MRRQFSTYNLCSRMLNYGTPLLVLTLALASVSYQKQQFFVPRQKGKCPTVELRIDDSASWEAQTFHDLGTTITRMTPRVCSPKTTPPDTDENTSPTTKFKCPPPEQVCPSKEALLALGYELLPGLRYYKLVKGLSKSYQNAKEMCEKEGSHLVVVNSEAEAKALNAFIDRVGIRGWYWSGFDDHEFEGQFYTIFNESVAEAGFAKLFPGEPNGGRGENCGIYRYDGHNYGLGDGNCAAGGWWHICERDDL